MKWFQFALPVLVLAPIFLPAQVISIASARSKPVGTVVTVRGSVTNGPELGKIRFLQDAGAGIAAYPGTGSAPGFENAVGAGDSIEVTGTLVSFHGLLEISPVSAYSVIVKGAAIPAPKNLSLSQLSEQYEGRLVGVECVVFSNSGVFSSGGYTVHDSDGETAEVFINAGNPLVGEAVPGAPVYLTGILSDYDGLQLLPRSNADFSQTLCFYFTAPQEQTEIATQSFRLSWQTNLSANTVIHYGVTPAMEQTVAVPGASAFNTFLLTNLQPGSVYWTQVEANHNGNIVFSPVRTFATSSLSSGQIKVFFNHKVDPASGNGYVPDGQSNTEVVAEVIARINAAEQTIDVAMYNNSRSDITNALKNAHARGVRVRYVAALDAGSTALDPPPPFPVIYGNADAIMHDKFMIIDADQTDKCWLMTGSMNWTNQNINTDFNNTLFIQDQSLARSYRLEFEEMWGSTGDLPDHQAARFGAAKTDNTPHRFLIGGKELWSWFSPSDRTTSHIVEALYEAQHFVHFALFSFTNNEIGDALTDIFNNQVSVAGMIENENDPGAELTYLQSVGIDCKAHDASGDLHHKYGIIDTWGANPVVVTGSHNWTFAAENFNDENTLILHDSRLAWLYYSEWQQRWNELTVPTFEARETSIGLFPNPARDMVYLDVGTVQVEGLSVCNILGESLLSAGPGVQSLDIRQLPAGVYYLMIRTRHGRSAFPFQKI